MSKIFPGLCTLLLIAAFSSTIKADPIEITTGSLTVSGLNGGFNFSFQGSNFAAAGTAGPKGNVAAQTICNPSCAAGTTISVNGQFTGSFLGVGNALINGTLYQGVGFAGTLNFSGTPFPVPSGSGVVTLTQIPFTFSGQLSGCQDPAGCANASPVFTVDLFGSGFATLELLQVGDTSQFVFRSITYDFGVPEPMSILLLATGLTALSVRVNRRKQ